MVTNQIADVKKFVLTKADILVATYTGDRINDMRNAINVGTTKGDIVITSNFEIIDGENYNNIEGDVRITKRFKNAEVTFNIVEIDMIRLEQVFDFKVDCEFGNAVLVDTGETEKIFILKEKREGGNVVVAYPAMLANESIEFTYQQNEEMQVPVTLRVYADLYSERGIPKVYLIEKEYFDALLENNENGDEVM